MRDLKINILNDEGKLIGFFVDREITNGLYIAFDLRKVVKNYQNFKIHYNTEKNHTMICAISSIDENIIVSIKIDDENHVQFVVDDTLSLKELRKIPENIIPVEFRKIIRSAYKKHYSNDYYPELAS